MHDTVDAMDTSSTGETSPLPVLGRYPDAPVLPLRPGQAPATASSSGGRHVSFDDDDASAGVSDGDGAARRDALRAERRARYLAEERKEPDSEDAMDEASASADSAYGVWGPADDSDAATSAGAYSDMNFSAAEETGSDIDADSEDEPSATVAAAAEAGKAKPIDSWYGHRRKRTAWGLLDPKGKKGNNGPHDTAHILKQVVARAGQDARAADDPFDPAAIRVRTGVLPSAGQNRKILRRLLEQEGRAGKIPLAKLKEYDRTYKKRLKDHLAGKPGAASAAMEMAAISTYALGRATTPAEMGGKAERRDRVIGTMHAFRGIAQGSVLPVSGVGIDDASGHVPKYRAKAQRDLGQLSLGITALSDLDTSSDDEY